MKKNGATVDRTIFGSERQWRKFERAQQNMMRFFKSTSIHAKKNHRRLNKWVRVVGKILNNLDSPF